MEVLEALSHLHENYGIIHGDLKGDNLLIGKDGRIKLANFEMSAKNASARNYIYVKSPHWMSPEVARADKINYSTKSDIWSLGIVCIQMAEKLPPLSSLNPEAAIDQIKSYVVPPGLRNGQNWSGFFNAFIGKCLNLNPRLRPSAKELKREEFVLNNKCDQNDMLTLLNERKRKFYTDAKNSVNRLEKNIKKSQFLKHDPKLYMQSYFEKLRGTANQQLEKAKKKLETDHAEIINALNKTESECLENAIALNPQNIDSFDKICKAYNSNINKWNKELEEKNLIDLSLEKTELEVQNLLNESDKILTNLKLDLFSNKLIKFEPKKVDSFKVGELIIDDRQGSKKDLADSSRDKMPVNKFLRLEVKGNKQVK